MIRSRTLAGCAALLTVTALPLAGSAESLSTGSADAAVAALPQGCAPLSSGVDSFPSTAKLVIDKTGFGEPFVVRLSSAGHPDALLQRAAQVGDTIGTELQQLVLSGFHPELGAITARESATQVSPGQITDVVQNGSCQLVAGDAMLDVYLDLELATTGETWIHQMPIRLETPLTALPPQNARFEVPFADPIAWLDQATLDVRGTLLYALHLTDPRFPPAGQDCFDTLFTADLELFGPQVTSGLIGFGPTTVVRGDTIAGGTCVSGGGPCQSDSDCPGFDVCRRDHVETELRQLDAAGFDIQLGNWSMSTLPDVGTSNCCDPTGVPGCSDPDCEAVICDIDPFCCQSDWDLLCAQLAQGEAVCADNCLDPDANPSLGQVTSVGLERTYPADSNFNLFLRLETDNEGTLHNAIAIPLAPAAPITNLPPDPETEYLRAAPIAMLDDNDTTVGEISNIVHKLQPPRDCQPPPLAGEDCFDSRMRVELTLPACPTEEVWLDGHFRVLRDDAVPGPGLGQDSIDSLMAKAEFSGTAPCGGPLTMRLSQSTASAGSVTSLTPDEFFPAEAFFDLHLELSTTGGTLTGGPSRSATTLNALPPDPGEVYFGPDSVLNLLDATQTQVGEILELSHELLSPIACPADCGSRILFTGPTDDEFSVAIPGGGAGADYDVVRGLLSSLQSNGGSFASASCLLTDVGAELNDGDEPPTADAYYYVSRDGLGAFNGSWDGPGAQQLAPRDDKLPDCQ